MTCTIRASKALSSSEYVELQSVARPSLHSPAVAMVLPRIIRSLCGACVRKELRNIKSWPEPLSAAMMGEPLADPAITLSSCVKGMNLVKDPCMYYIEHANQGKPRV